MPASVFHRRAWLDDDEDDIAVAIAARSFSVQGCQDKKAVGFEGKLYAQELQGIDIGVRLADKPLGISSVAILGDNSPFARIEAADKNVIVFTVSFPGDSGRTSYLIYDAVARSLRLIPMRGDKSWDFALSYRVLITRPHPALASDDYALVHMGRLLVHDDDDTAADAGQRQQDSLLLWRPSSTSSTPWSECKKASFHAVEEEFYQTDMEFSFDGHCYWVNLLCGVLFCQSDALFGNNSDDEAIKVGFIPLPIKHEGLQRSRAGVPQPKAYRTMGVVRDSIKFVSMDGFLEDVYLKDRKLTVWGRHGPDSSWEIERVLRLESLWGFMDAGKMLRRLTPMCPLLSSDHEDFIYLMLDGCQETRNLSEFATPVRPYLLAVGIPNGDILNSTRLDGSSCSPDLVSCDCSKYLRDAQRVACGGDGDSYAGIGTADDGGVHREVGKQS